MMVRGYVQNFLPIYLPDELWCWGAQVIHRMCANLLFVFQSFTMFIHQFQNRCITAMVNKKNTAYIVENSPISSG